MYKITLSDEEEARLREVAAQTGQTIENLVHSAVAERYPIAGTAAPSKVSDYARLLDRMKAKGHLVSEEEINDPDEAAHEARLPPYGSEEERKLLGTLARAAGEAFQVTGTTIADDIIEGRGE